MQLNGTLIERGPSGLGKGGLVSEESTLVLLVFLKYLKSVTRHFCIRLTVDDHVMIQRIIFPGVTKITLGSV